MQWNVSARELHNRSHRDDEAVRWCCLVVNFISNACLWNIATTILPLQDGTQRAQKTFINISTEVGATEAEEVGEGTDRLLNPPFDGLSGARPQTFDLRL